MLCVCLAASVCAQAPVPPTSAEPQKVTALQLDELLGPIALYPDPLVAIILPAAATPSDVVLANRMVVSKADAATIEKQPWDASVKALTHYPDVLKWMDENLAWTTSAGNAFVNQSTDVMNSIQQLRAKAKANGNLASTPQQKIETSEDKIVIVPAEPSVIYVPQYDPQVVYAASATPVVTPLISFGVGLAVGAWLNNSCNWYGGGVWCGGGGYGYGGSYNNNATINNNVNINNGGQAWQPPANRPGAPARPGGAGGVTRPGGPGGTGGAGGAGGPGGAGKPGGPGNIGGAGGPGGAGKPSGPGSIGGAGGPGGVDKPSGPGNVGGAGGAGKPSGPGNVGRAGNAGQRPSQLPANSSRPSGGGSGSSANRPSQSPANRPSSDAFSGYGRGNSTREASSRGQSSRQSSSSGGGGASRSSGGGGRSGGGGAGGRSGGGGRR